MDELEIAARKLCEIRGVDPDKLRMNHNMNWVMGNGEQAEWKFLIPEIEQELVSLIKEAQKKENEAGEVVAQAKAVFSEKLHARWQLLDQLEMLVGEDRLYDVIRGRSLNMDKQTLAADKRMLEEQKG